VVGLDERGPQMAAFCEGALPREDRRVEIIGSSDRARVVCQPEPLQGREVLRLNDQSRPKSIEPMQEKW